MSVFRPMIGHLLAFVVFVDGPPGSSAAFTEDEKTDLLRECFMAGGLLRRIGEEWGRVQQPTPVRGPCAFTVLSRSVTLARDPDALALAPATFKARTVPVMTEAYLELGFFSGSLDERNASLRKGLIARTFLGLGVADAFPLFITKYACHHTGFMAHGTVVLSLAAAGEDDDLRNNKDGVIAHEIGHIFDADDEYGHCTAGSTQGFFDSPNANCVLQSPGVPNPGQRFACLMDKNDHVICQHTALAWGWVDQNHDGLLDLADPATIELPERATSPGNLFIIKGRNVWDARVVSFGDRVTDVIGVNAPDSIFVTVPADVTGIVNVSLLTRAGMSSGSFDDTWVLVAPNAVPFPIGPAVFGVVPQSAPSGTKVRILGAGLRPVTAVTFGNVTADISGIDPDSTESSQQITVPVPPGASGTVTVTVTTPAGTSSPFPPFSEFTYS